MLQAKLRPMKKGPQQDLADCISHNFKTLGFCQRFLERAGQKNYSTNLNQLVKAKLVDAYPPIADIKQSWVSQHEHTFGIFERGTEVFSRTHE
jgi:methionyl aminopeptidase